MCSYLNKYINNKKIKKSMSDVHNLNIKLALLGKNEYFGDVEFK